MPSVKIGIHQPNFLPYGGFFRKVMFSDIFVILDNVQFSKNGYINRNRIKTPSGPLWLTVPVQTKGKSQQLINEVEISDNPNWRKKHLRTFEQYYKQTPFFNEVIELLEKCYSLETNKLVDLNIRLIENIREFLNLSADLKLASNLQTEGSSTERLVEICEALSGDIYLHGASGDKYMEFTTFERKGIELRLCDYNNPPYPQIGEGFEPNLSIIDMLFNIGKESVEVIKQDSPV